MSLLADRVAGKVVAEGDSGYDEARRVWNGMFDRRPLAIVQASSTADAEAVITFAREQGLPLAVRGGGHGVAGYGTVDGGIVLDLGGLQEVVVDTSTRTVIAAPGVTLGILDAATEPHGLIVPVGVVSGTGLAGLTLGGGFGWLTRAHGLTIDSLLAADLVTADGSHVHTSDTENPELFWGIRGGGGNFGVVTQLHYRAQTLGPTIYAGNLIYRRDNWRAALRGYAEWTRDLPDELTSIITFIVPAPEWELGDDTIMLVGFTWTGSDSAVADDLVDELRTLAAPDEEDIKPSRWVEWQSQADDLFPRGSRAYWKNVAFDELSQGVIDAILDHADSLKPGSAADIHHMGGAFARVPEADTAFPDRSAQYWLNVYGFWEDAADDADRTAWTRSFHRAMQPFARRGEYVNFLGREGEDVDRRQLAIESYGKEKFDRLVALKRRYDPTNLFGLNHNIPVD